MLALLLEPLGNVLTWPLVKKCKYANIARAH